jgi:hypothetical protein
MRLDADGTPWILEVNANPDLAPDAGLARMAGVFGLDYAALILRICDEAVAREHPLSPAQRWALSQQLSGVVQPELSLDALA